MDQFCVVYWPGGMTLDYSAWWLCERTFREGMYGYRKIKILKIVNN